MTSRVRGSIARVARVSLILITAAIVVAFPAALSGCRPRPTVSPGDSPEALAEAVNGLEWTLAVAPAPAAVGTYQLTIRNPGQTAVGLDGLAAYLEAEVGTPGSYPKSSPVSLPAEVKAGDSASLAFSLPTEASWPDSFVIVALAAPTAGNLAPVEVAQSTFSPGRIAFTAIWPEAEYVDFPITDYLLFRFEPAVSVESLAGSLSFDPATQFEVQPDTNQDSQVLEIHFPAGLEPYTRYTLTISADLPASDGAIVLGRGRSLVFSTGPGDYTWLGPPAFSPDGAQVAWVAPGPSGLTLFAGDVATMRQRVKVVGVQGSGPVFSPDGRYVYYAGLEKGSPNVSRLDLESGGSKVLVTNASLAAPAALTLQVSPDGLLLAVEADYGGVDAHSDLMKDVYVYNLASAALTHLPQPGLTSRLLGWSGQTPLYAATYQQFDNSHSFRYNLYRYEPGTQTETALLSAGELQNVGGFSLAGRDPSVGGATGAYWTWEAQNLGVTIVHRPKDIWMMWGLDESTVPGPIPLTGGGRYRDVALSPDATLAAAAKVVDGSWDVVILDTGDATERDVAGGEATQFRPAWSPDGTRIAYVEVQGREWRLLILDPVTDTVAAFQD